MGTAITGLEQLIHCILDCRDMRDFRKRREEAVERFNLLRAQNHACLGPFAVSGDKSYPIYAPWLFISLDRLLCGDFGLVPAFFGQIGDERGKPIGANSYSFSVYLTMPMAGYLWSMIWKHHYPAFPVPWDNGITDDLLRALGGASNIQHVSHPGYVPPTRPFQLDFNILSAAFAGGDVPTWVMGMPPPPPRPALQDNRVAETVNIAVEVHTKIATAGAGPAYIGRVASTQTVSPPLKAPLQSPPPVRVVAQPTIYKAAPPTPKKAPPPPPQSDSEGSTVQGTVTVRGRNIPTAKFPPSCAPVRSQNAGPVSQGKQQQQQA